MAGNGFSPEQEAFIRQVADEVVARAAPALIELHSAKCPWGATVQRWKYMAIGMVIMAGVAGVGGGLSAASMLARLVN